MNAYKSRQVFNILALASLAYLCGCSPMAASALVNTLNESTGDRDCRKIPTFVAPPQLKIDGILINNYLDRNKKRANIWMPLNILVHSEAEYVRTNTYAVIGGTLKKLRYVEIERPPGGDFDPMMQEFVAMGGDPQRKYLRFFLASDSELACEPFKQAVKAFPLFLRDQMVSNAPPGMCIAARAESESISDFSVRVVNQKDDRLISRPYSEPPATWQIVDRRNNTVYAQLERRIETYSCPRIQVRQQFWNLITPKLDKPKRALPTPPK